MKEYDNYPPEIYFARILKTYPRSAHLYCQLWRDKNKNSHNITLTKKAIRKAYLVSPTLFRNLIAPLALLGLITFSESDEGTFSVKLMGSRKDNERVGPECG